MRILLLVAGISLAPAQALARADFEPEHVDEAEPDIAEDEGWPDGIEPFILGSTDDRGSLQLSLAIQGLFSMDVTDIDSEQDSRNEAGAQFRRLRFVLKGHLLTPAFTYLLHLSTLPGSLELMDLFIDYRFHSHVRLRAGSLKIPLTRFRNNSFKNLSMVDWPLPTQYFGAERQLGLVLHNGYGANAFEYELGLMTGVATRPSHAQGLARLYGETMPNRSDLTGPTFTNGVHPEIVLHLAYNFGSYEHKPEADMNGGPPRFSIGASAAWDIRPVYTEDLSLRVAPELWFKAYGLHVHVTGYLGFSEIEGRMDQTAPTMWAAVAAAGYTFGSRVDLSVQYAHMGTIHMLRADARERADEIIAAATDPDEALALTEQYENAGAFERRHEVCLGVIFFIIGQSLKWSTDLAYLNTTASGQVSHDMRFRTQLQLVF
jgi:hypothetical protein